MATHSFPGSPIWFHYIWWFYIRKTFERSQTQPNIYMLAGSCGWGSRGKYQNRTPKVANKAFNIRVIWKPVCCHGNKILISFSEKRYLRDIFSHYSWSKFGWVYDVITWLICIFQKMKYLWNKERHLKIVNIVLFLV